MSFQTMKPIIVAAFAVLCGVVLLDNNSQQQAVAAGPSASPIAWRHSMGSQFMPLTFQGDCKNGNCPDCPNGKCPLIPGVVDKASKAVGSVAGKVAPNCDNGKCQTNGQCKSNGSSNCQPKWNSVIVNRNSCQRSSNRCQPSRNCQPCRPRCGFFFRR